MCDLHCRTHRLLTSLAPRASACSGIRGIALESSNSAASDCDIPFQSTRDVVPLMLLCSCKLRGFDREEKTLAETTIIVCDVCGRSPGETVSITAGGRSYRKDLCTTHLFEVLQGAHAPLRGRPRKAAAAQATAPRRRGRPPKVAQAAPAAPRRRGRPPKAAQTAPTTPRRRGRPPKATQAAASAP